MVSQWTPLLDQVKQPSTLWDSWGPSRGLDQYEDVKTLWVAYVDGEIEQSSDGALVQRPPMERLELQFQAKWRSNPDVRPFANLIRC